MENIITCIKCDIKITSENKVNYNKKCKDCSRKDNTAYKRKRNQEKPGEYARHIYHNMLKRLKNGPTYQGLPICTLEEFMEFTINDPDFLEIWMRWRTYDTIAPPIDTPSIDRIYRSKGYALDNLRWVTKAENNIEAGYIGAEKLYGKKYEPENRD